MSAASLSPKMPVQSARQVLLWMVVFTLGLALLSFGIHTLTQNNNLGNRETAVRLVIHCLSFIGGSPQALLAGFN